MSHSALIDRRTVIDWLGIAPFMIFALLFLILPTLYLVTGAFVTLTTLMTRPKPEWQRAEERLSRDVDQAIDYGRHIEADVERAVRDQMPAGTSLD